MSNVYSKASSDLDFDVSVRGAGTATIHAGVYANPANRGDTTILAVHGLTATASTFAPLAQAIFADSALGRTVRRLVSIDLPGRGGSSIRTLPTPLRFSDLTIADNVSVVLQSIDTLRARGLGAQVIMAHSMGALAVQAAQEQLLAADSSLAKHGIAGAILLAPVPNRGAVWTRPPPANVTSFIVTTDEALGPYLAFPPAAAAAGQTWRTLANTLAANAPTAAQIDENHWGGIEPLTACIELMGSSPPLWRPFARQGAFDLHNGTRLTLVSFSQDVLSPAVDQDGLYVYLTGHGGPLYHPVVAPDAVHGMHISNPTGLLSAIGNGLC